MRSFAIAAALLFVGAGVVAKARSSEEEDSPDSASWFEKLSASLWNPIGTIEILNVTTNTTKLSGYGETIKPDRGYVFHEVQIRFVNTGSTPLPVSTWHFNAANVNGREWRAETSMAHHDFDGTSVRKAGTREGLVIFELPLSETIASVIWQGEIAWARADVG